MKAFLACLLISVAAWAQSEGRKADNAATPRLSIASFGLNYPLSSDWVRATELTRKAVASPQCPLPFRPARSL